MKVIFVKDVSGGPKKGQVKEVSAGYAQNYLIPKGFAKLATSDVQAKVEKEAREADKKKQKQQLQLEQAKKQLESSPFTVKVKVGDKGQIFGGVHEKEIAEVVRQEVKVNLEKSQITIVSPIKELGQHQVTAKLGGGVVANIKIKVTANT